MRRSGLLLAVLALLSASPLMADSYGSASAPPVVRFFDAPPQEVALTPWSERSSLTRADTLVYDNSNVIQAWFSAGANIEHADDIHLTQGGPLSSIVFGYFNNTQNPVGIVVRIYRGSAQSDSLFELLAGPYAGLLPQPGPRPLLVELVPEDRPILTEHLWFSVTFNTAEAGLVFANPPRIGTSENLYYDFSRGGVQTEIAGFEVPLNWYVRIRVEQPVAVEQKTWTQVKTLYTVR